MWSSTDDQVQVQGPEIGTRVKEQVPSTSWLKYYIIYISIIFN